MDAAELIRSGQLPERSVPICLAGALTAQHEDLTRKLTHAERMGGGSLEGNPEARRLADEITALETAMAEHVIEIRLRALPRKRWASLIAAHPARKDDANNPVDPNGYNADTFVAAALRECVVEPDLDDELWTILIDERLSDGQYEVLTTAMWELNRAGVNVPFSRAASRIRQASAPE